MKIITLCGSYRFKKEMAEIAERLTLSGNCVLAPIDLVREKEAYTKEERDILAAMHREKIKLAEAVFVVNMDGYIGESTKGEIEFAEMLGKEIFYYTDQNRIGY